MTANLVNNDLGSVLSSASRAGSDADGILSYTNQLADMVTTSPSLVGATKVSLNAKIADLASTTQRFHTDASERISAVRQNGEVTSAVSEEGAGTLNGVDTSLI